MHSISGHCDWPTKWFILSIVHFIIKHIYTANFHLMAHTNRPTPCAMCFAIHRKAQQRAATTTTTKMKTTPVGATQQQQHHLTHKHTAHTNVEKKSNHLYYVSNVCMLSCIIFETSSFSLLSHVWFSTPLTRLHGKLSQFHPAKVLLHSRFPNYNDTLRFDMHLWICNLVRKGMWS